MEPTHPRRLSISLPPRVMSLLLARVAAAREPRATKSGQVAEAIKLAGDVERRRSVAIREHAQRIADAELTGLLDLIAGEAPRRCWRSRKTFKAAAWLGCHTPGHP